MSRPFDLDALFRRLTTLPGIGDKNAALFEKLIGGQKVLDLLLHLPIDFIDRRFSPTVNEAPNGRVATMEVRVVKHFPNARRGQPYRVKCADNTGEMTLTFFHANKGWIEKQLPEGSTRITSGKVEYYQGKPQIVHPDIATVEERSSLEAVEPVYPLTAGVTNKVVRKAMQGSLGFIPRLPEWLEPTYKAKQKWLDWHQALEGVHSPESAGALEGAHPLRQRLAYDELLANQLTLALVRQRQRGLNGRVFEGTNELRAKMMEALPFALTGAQERALGEIDDDMSAKAGCCAFCKGMSAAGRPLWPHLRCCARWKPVRKPR